jgi:transposase-like protein
MAQKYKAADVADAIRKAQGNVSHAARLLGCDRGTVYNYIHKYQTVEAALDEARESMLDYVESKLLEAISGGNITAMIFYLKTQGRNRGYVERQEVTGSGGGAIVFRTGMDVDEL